jgi:hypothetical protein
LLFFAFLARATGSDLSGRSIPDLGAEVYDGTDRDSRT